MKFRVIIGILLASLTSVPVRANAGLPEETEMVPPKNIPPEMSAGPGGEETPLALRWMIHSLPQGMFLNIPVIDTDPNRGITYGLMPIVVLKGADGNIKTIHAPSLTYNHDFKFTPTYRLYYYPQEDASLVIRASRGKFEHEGFIEYTDRTVFGSPYDLTLRGQKNRDAGQRFFGIGPNTPRAAETNYIQDYWQFRWGLGMPFAAGSYWRVHLSERYESSTIQNGPLVGLPAFEGVFPSQYSLTAQQTNEVRLTVDYDSRDHATTPTRGAYAEFFAESALNGFLSEYDYKRYGSDVRWFAPWSSDAGKVFAVQGLFEQLTGPPPPFWLMPSLGGKYSLRAYGDGRYVDRGLFALNVEQRIKIYEAKTEGVTTEIQLAPFAGVGTVFDSPGTSALRFLRPLAGAAIRAVARPQVVGSVDFGVGREGVAVFTDINYSF